MCVYCVLSCSALCVCVQVNKSGGLLATGFEDGVVRLLDVFDPRRLRAVPGGGGRGGDADLRLRQAFKPHNAPVTAIAYERNGEILATGVSGRLAVADR